MAEKLSDEFSSKRTSKKYKTSEKNLRKTWNLRESATDTDYKTFATEFLMILRKRGTIYAL